MSDQYPSSKGERAPLLQTMHGSIQEPPGGMGRTASAPHSSILDIAESPAYAALYKSGLIVTKYRIRSETEIEARPSNSTPESGALLTCMAYSICLPCAPCIWSCVKRFTVPQGNLKLITDGRGNYEFCAPGVHQINDYWVTALSGFKSIQTTSAGGSGIGQAGNIISHGDRTLVTIPQGFVGYAEDQGEPVLLPPGMHQWRSATLQMERMIDLNSGVIQLGPLTLLTVDEGYAAITQNNGKQVILPGGAVHLLTHRNWKFEKFVSQKIQTTDLDNVVTPSADNVLMVVSSTVAWQIIDVQKAAMNAIATMNLEGMEAGNDIAKLRYDVLKQAEASLSSFIGTVNYSGSFGVAAAVQQGAQPTVMVDASPSVRDSSEPEPQAFEYNTPVLTENALYDGDGMLSAIMHANEMTMNYGVKILSINIISAKPKDDSLMASLALGAVAAAEARQAETAAYGQAAAVKVEAQGNAQAHIIKARGAAEANRIAAEGALKAAQLLEKSSIAADLAKIDRTGAALGSSSKFFFGNGLSPANLGELFGAEATDRVKA